MLKFYLMFLPVVVMTYACGPGSVGVLSSNYGPSKPYQLAKGLLKNSIPNKQIDADFVDIIAEFRADLDLHKVSYDPQKFDLLKVVTVVDKLPQTHRKDAVAICRKIKKKNVGILGTTSYSWLEINVDQEHYLKQKNKDKNKLKILLYHELGHCILDLHHLPENEVGIMSLNVGKIQDPENFAYYVDRMFHPVDNI